MLRPGLFFRSCEGDLSLDRRHVGMVTVDGNREIGACIFGGNRDLSIGSHRVCDHVRSELRTSPGAEEWLQDDRSER